MNTNASDQNDTNSPTAVEWYFDFLSPFAYLQSHRLDELPNDVELTLRPILFGGLVGHWETKGPGQIPPKRQQLLRHTLWLSNRMEVPYSVPPKFPFNPLKALRLALSLGCDRETVKTIFGCIWSKGLLPEDDAGWQGIVEALGMSMEDAEARINTPEIKQALVDNGQRAVAAGLFGVPTFIHDNKLFWGVDETDFLLDALADPQILRSDEMALIESIPVGQRPGSD